MRISIVGCGYVGLVTGACLAQLGSQVIFVDSNDSRLEIIRQRKSPIYERGVEDILRSVRLEATSDLRYAIRNSDITFICVSTDVGDTERASDLSRIREVSEEIGTALSVYHLVVVKSTVLPNVAEEVILPLLEKHGKRAGSDFGVCVNPEFLREGMAVETFLHPDRIVIGELDKRSGDILSKLYEGFKCPIMRVSLRAAAVIKYASNAFLATKISFVNEIGNICKELGVDSYRVAEGMGYDSRIGGEFLKAGVGFGGSCLPKDLRALITEARDLGVEPRLLEATLKVNENQPLRMIRLLKKHVPELRDRYIGVLGLAFKPGTDDVRDSRAINVVSALVAEGARVRAYDPAAMENFKNLFPHIEYVTPEEVLECEAVLIVTDWPEFEDLDYARNIVVISGRRVMKANEARIHEGLCW